jgi:[ribosomal protein S18]-alanine N-acetyltransferase
MLIRAYQVGDKEGCLDVFRSNCPKYFDESEFELFARWLDHQAGEGGYSSPTYSNSIHDAYFVVEIPDAGVVGCGGFYIQETPPEARLAWGMIHSEFHGEGFGTAIYKYRKKIIHEKWPGFVITLGTSQHTFAFYKKMGLNVTAIIPSGYGPQFDRYDMVEGK